MCLCILLVQRGPRGLVLGGEGEINRGIREVEVELRMLVLCYVMCDASVGHDRRR